MGILLLFAAVITWGGGAADESARRAVAERHRACAHRRSSLFMRNSAIGTLILSALAGWLLFPRRRPNSPIRDWVIAACSPCWC